MDENSPLSWFSAGYCMLRVWNYLSRLKILKISL